MAKRLEQVTKLYQFLEQEFVQLQNNIQCYLEVCRDAALFFKDMKSVNCIASLKACDSFTVNITSVMNLIRKFNLQFKLHYSQCFREFVPIKEKEKAEISENFSKSSTIETNTSSDCSVQFENLTLKEKNLELVSKENEITSNSVDEENFICCRFNLMDTYNVDVVLNAKITFVDVGKRKFFIRFANSEQEKTIRHLEQSVSLYQYLDIPPEFRVFGLDYNNQIVRATRASTSLYDNELKEIFWYCYLLDSGEIVRLQEQHRTYKLTLEQQQIPAQAIQCRLKETENLDFSVQFLNKKYLREEQALLKIIKVNENYLEVSIIELNESSNDDADSKADHSTLRGLNETEMEELYEEEPFCTSNIMKAVLGYDPQDEKRICRFYDPATGGCFKGARCRQEHIPFQPEGWTKDIIPDSSLVRKYIPDVVYQEGEFINITPTCVIDVGLFYCQINNVKETLEPLIWTEDMVPKWDILNKPPLLFELVLCPYVDKFWYRAQIISFDDNMRVFKVFYVDYGNTDLVPLGKIAKCNKMAVHLPYRAILCRVDGPIYTAAITKEKRRECINLMTEMLINEDLNAKVCSHSEILTINFIDEPYASLMKLIRKKLNE